MAPGQCSVVLFDKAVFCEGTTGVFPYFNTTLSNLDLGSKLSNNETYSDK